MKTAVESMADLLHRLGDIPPERVRMKPLPGTAKIKDVIDIEAHENRLFELVEGVLVEKAMGSRESVLAGAIIEYLRQYAKPQRLGIVMAPDGMMEILGGMVRMPDVAYISRARLPGGKVPKDAVPRLAPDLAVEIISRGNTKAEMTRKRSEYFKAGVRIVWEVDQRSRTVTVYTSPNRHKVLNEDQVLDGGTVLPGFSLKLKDLFAELE